MSAKSIAIKVAAIAGLGTGIVCLVDGLLWDSAPFNKYQGMFWLSFMPLILFFMREPQERKYLGNMLASFAAGLLWGLLAIAAAAVAGPSGVVPLDIVIDFVLCGLIVFVHKGLMATTPFNAVACVFLGFAETLGCLTTSFPVGGELLPPGSLNGFDLMAIFAWGVIAAYAVSWLCDLLVEKAVIKEKRPKSPSAASAGRR